MDIITKMDLSNNCKVFRVLDDNNSIVMNELDIRKVCDYYSSFKLVI